MAAEVLHTPVPPATPSNMEYVDTETRIGDTVLTPGFKKHLESYYLKAPIEDRAKCLELLASLDIGQALRSHGQHGDTACNGELYPSPPPPDYDRPRRPKTAMAAISTERTPRDPYAPYVTTYGREFSGLNGPSGRAERPGTSRAFQASYDLSGPVGNTTYQLEFYKKREKKSLPIRTGTASGNRRNNPHPLEAFMKWRFPQTMVKEQPGSQWSTELTDDVMDRVCRGKLQSTYQQDYLGIPQGYQVKDAFSAPPDWKSKVPYTLDSSTRHCYQIPNQHPNLKGNTVRYGCNKKKMHPAFGVVPAVSNRHMNTKTRTTYEREYLDPFGCRPKDVRDLGKQYGSTSLARRVEVADDTEKEDLTRIMQSMNNGFVPQPPRASPTGSSRLRSAVPPATTLMTPDPYPPASPIVERISPMCTPI